MPRVAFPAGPQLAVVLIPLLGCGPSAGTSSSPAPSGATVPGIATADLRSRLYAYADDSMQGRRSGTPGNLKATDFIAAEARRIGLEPAGENGGWFQTVPIVRAHHRARFGAHRRGHHLQGMGRPAPPRPGQGHPLGGRRARHLRRGLGPGPDRPRAGPRKAGGHHGGAGERGAPRPSSTGRRPPSASAPRRAVLVATLDAIDGSDPARSSGRRRPARERREPRDTRLHVRHAPEWPRRCWARRPPSSARGPRAARCRATSASWTLRPPRPARNVVAILRGSDPALRGQMVAIGAHNDHDGIGPETAGPRLAPRLQPGDAPRRRQQHPGRADG